MEVALVKMSNSEMLKYFALYHVQPCHHFIGTDSMPPVLWSIQQEQDHLDITVLLEDNCVTEYAIDISEKDTVYEAEDFQGFLYSTASGVGQEELQVI